MGCVFDTPQKVRPRPRDQASPALSPKAQVSQQTIDQGTLRNDFITIMQGIQQMPKPDRTSPIVCISDVSFPILIAPLSLEEGDSTGVTLPVIGISRYSLGRGAIVGNTEILMHCTRENTDGSAFLENMIKWCSGVSRGRVSMAIVGFSSENTETLQKNLSGFGFRVVVASRFESIEHVQVVVVPSDYDDDESQSLVTFVENGGGLLCSLQTSQQAQNDPDRYKMNAVMNEIGLGFPFTELLVGPVNAPHTKVNSHVSVLSKYTFYSLANALLEVLKKPEIDITELDACVTAVRFNVGCMPQSSNPMLVTLETAAFKYLKDHNFESPEGYCANILHGIISALICEIQAKVVASVFVGFDLSERFPGKASEEPDNNDVVNVHVDLQYEGWTSTGYWVPAGVMATITCEKEIQKGLLIQVGSHTEVIVSKEGPWKRWPSITTSFNLEQTTEVASPFGGMIYIILPRQLESPLSLDLVIDHVFPYPRFTMLDPSVWEQTRDRGAPWAEVETKYITFVAPARVVRAAKSLTESSQMIDDLIESVFTFLGDTQKHNFRCVFDIELPDGPICGYPIIISVEQSNHFFGDASPSDALFILTTYIAMLSLPEGAFDSNKESSLACAAACVAFLKKWPDVSPLNYSSDMLPPHFNELWNIYKKDNGKALTAAMISIRSQDYMSQDQNEIWNSFISEIQLQTGLSLDYLIDAAPQKERPAGFGMVSAMSSASLQSFQLRDEI